MRWSDWSSLIFVVAVAAYAIGLASQADTFAARWAPALTMQPTLDMTLNTKGSADESRAGQSSNPVDYRHIRTLHHPARIRQLFDA